MMTYETVSPGIGKITYHGWIIHKILLKSTKSKYSGLPPVEDYQFVAVRPGEPGVREFEKITAKREKVLLKLISEREALKLF